MSKYQEHFCINRLVFGSQPVEVFHISGSESGCMMGVNVTKRGAAKTGAQEEKFPKL